MPSSTTENLHNFLSNALSLSDYQGSSNPIHKNINNVPKGALSLVIAHLYQQYQGSILIICTDPQMTDQIERELPYFNNQVNFLPFPDWETLPYDNFSPHPGIVSERINTLYKLSITSKAVTSISLTTSLYKLCPCDFIKKHSFSIKVKDKLDLHKIRQELVTYGYLNTFEVSTPGEFSIKGSLVDLYPMGSDLPYRIDLFDDEIDSIRIFDPETQKSLHQITEITLLPAHEFPFSEQSIKTFRSNWRNSFTSNPLRSKIFEDISGMKIPGGIEYYIPLFFDDLNMSSIFDYLADNSLVVLINAPSNINNISDMIAEFNQTVLNRYTSLNIDSNNPLLEANKLFYNSQEFFSKLNKFNRLDLNLGDFKATKSWHTHLDITELNKDDISIDRHLLDPLEKLKKYIADNNQSKILLCAESTGRKEVILELLKKHSINNINDLNASTTIDNNKFTNFIRSEHQLNIDIAKLDNGFLINNKNCNIIVISESELYGEQVQQRRLRKIKATDPNNIIKDLAELKPNQFVVHQQHGIGKYLGLETITVNNIKSEYLSLLYDNDAKLFVPITALDKISRYSGLDEENIKLHKLGNKTWSAAKEKALNKIRDTAAELLGIYAERAATKGFAYKISDEEYSRFCAEFKFEETPDQLLTINQVLEDMQKPITMDRLVCGDVGFGKTEVALRAAFIAADNNKQVAVLVPTTLLAQQHYENFCDRFANFPIKIELLSRFKTTAQQNITIENITSGKADIIIATHKLLQDNIKFKDLGLLIIDEEHRFGVAQKEKIKKLRTTIDILTLTATPIPRTLNLSLTGIRDLSIITTPPQKRLAIKTFVFERSKDLITEAITRELKRGGQVYFLHNNIKTIYTVYDEIAALFPDTNIAVAHGQMRERELEKIMSDFYHRKYQVLVCTTIIETGIDIPSANTIIIDRADKLGLAQLHQLRGRVGRSHHQAYAYLFIPKDAIITPDATKRLEAIKSLENLGAGFMLASHDMEIRGTGNFLGDEQSGHIEAIGYNLYIDLLNKTIDAIKSGRAVDLNDIEGDSCEVDLKVSALFPDDYIYDVNQRLMLYKRLAGLENKAQLEELKLEITDRFGKTPQPVDNLFTITAIKILANKIGINKIDISDKSGKIKFNKNPKINHSTLISLIQNSSSEYKLTSGDVLNFYFSMEKVEQKYHTVTEILRKIAA